MPKYRFMGRVFPLFKEFTVAGEITATKSEDVVNPASSLVLVAKMTIKKAIVEVVCDSNLCGSDEYDTRAYFLALDLAQSVIAVYGFGTGQGLSVVLETVVKPDGVLHNLHDYYPHLQALVSALSTEHGGGLDVGKVLPLIMDDPTLMVALADLMESLRNTREAPFRCGRAIDAIRYYFCPTLKRKDGWPVMREKLNLSHPYLSFITDESTGPRHGDLKNTGWDTNTEILTRTWIIMNRFLEFRLRGNQPLPLNLFRTL